ncbi:hypothetical protein HYQ09_gp081 [Acinetobacter phage vB_AbaM_Konradin]|uniref:Uncharacterized protein n=1 Tax=Acinetobacter phage vB_AbaM_Konradin TaxID=2666257 RepID=A0A650EW63_9CAUD|nr:hypothetical protein HYQ09_gp081 [Acinetobacter phage vB_AbaM_Konradin]QGT53845.1 hypothetical protein Konradin_082 [Acinetobacter phage vB_AbaM_Konradin]
MKFVLIALALAIPSLSFAEDIQMCKGWDKRCLADQQRRIDLEEDMQNHRKMLQTHIDDAVERERPVLEKLRNKPQMDAATFVIHTCRQMAIEQTLIEFGYLKSPNYQKLLKQCIGE